MVRDERFYAFIISYTSRSRSQIRRICLHKKWLKLSAAVAVVVLGAALYGFYGLTQQAAHLRIELENQRLRAETDRQRQELNELNHRVEAVEDTSRKLAEKSGVVNNNAANVHGRGGPAIPLDSAGLAALEGKMNRLEQDLRAHEAVLRERGFTPSIWPVDGKLESGFGGRRNPFGGSSYELHTGQDIVVAMGHARSCGRQGHGHFCWLAEWLRTARGNRSRRRSDNSIWSSFRSRCRAGTGSRSGRVYRARGLNGSINWSTPAL